MTAIAIRGLVKRFGSTVAVNHIDLDVPSGSLFFLLGPSGCGKTTLLRMIAGFTEPNAGSIRFGDQDVSSLPANQRNCGMVFQNYALWPHMTIAQNVAFGLDVRKIPAQQKQQRVEEALRTVQMQALAQRKPNQLSGGQQQRVALARALVIHPTVLLLDEPLSNLDAKLRLEMRGQIRQICKQVGITAVYVTHDQKEALSMADQVAVLRDGQVIQVGRPRELYERPANRFVADFLGETNFVSAQIVAQESGRVILECPAGRFESTVLPPNLPGAGNVTCSIRPEALKLWADHDHGSPPAVNRFAARRADTVYLGEMAQHQVTVGSAFNMKVFELNPRPLNDSAALQVCFDPSDVVILQD